MRLRNFIPILALASVSAFAHTPESGNVYAIVGPFLSRATSIDDKWKSGGGLVAQGDVDQNGGIEIAILSADKYYARRFDNAVIIESIQRMVITTGYRHWFTKSLSAGVSFYSAYSMGDVRTISDEGGTDNGRQTRAHDVTEYGYDVSIQTEWWEIGRWTAIADARFSDSLSKKSHEVSSELGALIGLKTQIAHQKQSAKRNN